MDEFTEYVTARWPTLVRSAVLLGCTPSEAEDLVQSALERCLLKWNRVRAAEDRDAYVHRVGRTGRAGRSGAGVSFVMAEQVDGMKKIAAELGLSREFDNSALGRGSRTQSESSTRQQQRRRPQRSRSARRSRSKSG